MMRMILAGLLTCLAACASSPRLPSQLPALTLPGQWLLHEASPAGQRELILVVQQEATALRWSLLDPLGIPVARQTLDGGTWANDGLLPPQGDARGLFAALLFAWTPRDLLPDRYPSSLWRADTVARRLLFLHAQVQWQVDYAGDDTTHFTLTDARGNRWQVEPLEGPGP